MKINYAQCDACLEVAIDVGDMSECCEADTNPVTVVDCGNRACEHDLHHFGLGMHVHGPDDPPAFPSTNMGKPCDDCPFRKNAAPGWLGPWEPLDLYQSVMSEQPFACHQTIDSDGHPIEETELCVGSMMFASKCGKSFRTPELEAQRLRHQPEADQCMGIDFLKFHGRDD